VDFFEKRERGLPKAKKNDFITGAKKIADKGQNDSTLSFDLEKVEVVAFFGEKLFELSTLY
jgi:hypothetical protein